MDSFNKMVEAISAWCSKHPRLTHLLLIAVFVAHLLSTDKRFYQVWDTVFAAVFSISLIHYEFHRKR